MEGCVLSGQLGETRRKDRCIWDVSVHAMCEVPDAGCLHSKSGEAVLAAPKRDVWDCYYVILLMMLLVVFLALGGERHAQ